MGSSPTCHAQDCRGHHSPKPSRADTQQQKKVPTESISGPLPHNSRHSSNPLYSCCIGHSTPEHTIAAVLLDRRGQKTTAGWSPTSEEPGHTPQLLRGALRQSVTQCHSVRSTWYVLCAVDTPSERRCLSLTPPSPPPKHIMCWPPHNTHPQQAPFVQHPSKMLLQTGANNHHSSDLFKQKAEGSLKVGPASPSPSPSPSPPPISSHITWCSAFPGVSSSW